MTLTSDKKDDEKKTADELIKKFNDAKKVYDKAVKDAKDNKAKIAAALKVLEPTLDELKIAVKARTMMVLPSR